MGHVVNAGVLFFSSRDIWKFFQNSLFFLILIFLDLILILSFFHPLLMGSLDIIFIFLFLNFCLERLFFIISCVGFSGIFASYLFTVIVFFILNLRVVVKRTGNFDGGNFDYFRLGYESKEGRND